MYKCDDDDKYKYTVHRAAYLNKEILNIIIIPMCFSTVYSSSLILGHVGFT